MSVRFLIAVLAVATLAIPLRAEEGLWMPDQIPQLTSELKAAGIKIPANRLSSLSDHPLGAIVQTAGCTASFVSPDGLLLTNYHCAFTTVQYNSTPEKDLIRNGFVARTRDEELWNGPLSRVFVTAAVTDVTKRLIGGIPPSLSDRERYSIIDRREKELIAECEKPGAVRCRAVSAYEGLQYLLITQNELRDVRLVYAPPRATGEFGGDQDNWMWPRHAAEFAFFRAYVAKDGSPADYSKKNIPFRSPTFLKISTRGINPGDGIVVAGYPAKTFRYKTADETRHMRDSWYPRSIRYTREYIRILESIGARDEDAKLRNAALLLKYANMLKNMEGTLAGVNAGSLVQRKESEETRLLQASGKVGNASEILADVTELSARLRKTEERDELLYWMMRFSSTFQQAVLIYRASLEKTKPDLERQWGYQERDLPRIRESVERAQRSLDLESEKAALRFLLLEIAGLPADQRIDALDHELSEDGQPSADEVDAFLERLFTKTRMADVNQRLAMLDLSTSDLRARKDSFIELATLVTPLVVDIEREYEDLWAAMTAVRPRYMEALQNVRGGKLYPDANATLRVSFGRVEGYSPRDAIRYAPQTSLSGLLQKDRGSEPFEISPALCNAAEHRKVRRYIDPDLGTIPINFLSTADTTSGSSGSPTLNADGELVGIVFDGNYEAISSDFVFNRDLTRTIHVDALYMLWIMDAVDGAHELMQELGIDPQFD